MHADLWQQLTQLEVSGGEATSHKHSCLLAFAAQSLNASVCGILHADSDGKIDRFISPGGSGEGAPVLPLHELDGQPYLLAMFLTGAYQEVHTRPFIRAVVCLLVMSLQRLLSASKQPFEGQGLACCCTHQTVPECRRPSFKVLVLACGPCRCWALRTTCLGRRMS